MSGVAIGRQASSTLYPNCRDYDIAVNQVITSGDLVVLTGVGGVTRVRKLTATDITNNFTESSVVKGILGMAMHDASTDVNGVSLSPISPSYVSAGARPIYPVPNYAASMDVDPVTGNSKLIVALADDFSEYLIRIAAAGNTNVTVTPNLIQTLTGIQIVSTTDFSANTGASGAGLCLTVTGVDEQDRNYNTASTVCKAYVKVLPAYQQFKNGALYAS